MSVNIELLRKAVEFAEQSAARQQPSPVDDDNYEQGELIPESDPEPRVWNQGTWSEPKQRYVSSPNEATLEHCGTAYCIAGYVTSQQPGYEVSVEAERNYWDDDEPEYLVVLRETIDGEPFRHSEVARNALGLSVWQAERLFNASNTLEDVRQIAEDLAVLAGETL